MKRLLLIAVSIIIAGCSLNEIHFGLLKKSLAQSDIITAVKWLYEIEEKNKRHAESQYLIGKWLYDNGKNVDKTRYFLQSISTHTEEYQESQKILTEIDKLESSSVVHTEVQDMVKSSVIVHRYLPTPVYLEALWKLANENPKAKAAKILIKVTKEDSTYDVGEIVVDNSTLQAIREYPHFMDYARHGYDKTEVPAKKAFIKELVRKIHQL